MISQSRFLAARLGAEDSAVYVWWIDAKEADRFHDSQCHCEFIPYQGAMFTIFCHESIPTLITPSLRQAFIDAIAGKYQWNIPS